MVPTLPPKHNARKRDPWSDTLVAKPVLIYIASMGARMSATALELPSWLFWDCDPASVDLNEHAPTIVSRVVERGRLEDWRAIRAFYGDDQLRQIVTGLRWLSPQALSFCCVTLDVSQEDFRCCTATPFPPAPWIS